MLSAFCLLATSAILFFIIKYRVHVHVTYTPTSSRGRKIARNPGRRAATLACANSLSSTAMTRPVKLQAIEHPESVVWGDIASGLVNLGASKADARRAARKACTEYPDADFNAQFTVALQEVGRAA